MLKLIIVVLFTCIFVSAAIFFLRALSHFYHMNIEVKSKKHDLARNLIPLMALTKTPYTEQGKIHLEAFTKNLLISLAHFALIAIAYLILGIK